MAEEKKDELKLPEEKEPEKELDSGEKGNRGIVLGVILATVGVLVAAWLIRSFVLPGNVEETTETNPIPAQAPTEVTPATPSADTSTGSAEFATESATPSENVTNPTGGENTP